MSDNQYDDSAKGGYTYEEKLDLVAQGLMDPKEIGLAEPAEAEAALPKEPKIESYIAFECSEVPVGIRAQWALKDEKIQPANPRGFMADWIENCKDHLIQGRLHTGNLQAKLQQTMSEPVLGMIAVMREAADLIEKKYVEIQQSRTEIEDKTNE